MRIDSKIYRRLVTLGLPILVGQVGMIVVMFADNIMIGRYSTAALASASFVNNLFNLANMTVLGFTYGVTPIVGALYSQLRQREIGDVMRNAVRVNILFGIFVTAVMTAVYFNLERFSLPGHLLPLIRPYYLLVLAGIIPIALFNALAQWSYAVNDSRSPMWIILFANGVNIFGNWLLIYGNLGFPELGLTGAGISTALARIICPAAIIVYFFCSRRNRECAAGFRESHCSRSRMKEVFGTSLPVALQMGFESGSFSFAAIVTGILGEIPLASYQVIVIVGTLGFCIYYSLGAAVSVLVSNAKGEGRAEGMRTIAWHGYHLMLVLATLSSLTFLFFGESLIHLFTTDPAVISMTLTLLLPLILYQLGDATQINFANALRGTGYVLPMVWIAFVSYLVVGAPATWLLGITWGYGIYGVVLSFSVSLFLAGALFTVFFLRATRMRG